LLTLLTDLTVVVHTFWWPIKCSWCRQTFTRWQRRNRKCWPTEICAKQSIWQILKRCTDQRKQYKNQKEKNEM